MNEKNIICSDMTVFLNSFWSCSSWFAFSQFFLWIMNIHLCLWISNIILWKVRREQHQFKAFLAKFSRTATKLSLAGLDGAKIRRNGMYLPPQYQLYQDYYQQRSKKYTYSNTHLLRTPDLNLLEARYRFFFKYWCFS